MIKKLICALLPAVALAACAQPTPPDFSEAPPLPAAPKHATISAGASDDIGAFIPQTNQRLSLEASALPAR